LISLVAPPQFALIAREAGYLTLASDHGDQAHIFVLEEDLLRILLLPRGRLREPKTFAIAPGAEDVAQQGRGRFDLSGFALPDFMLETGSEQLSIETKAIRLAIKLIGFFCTWELRAQDEWRPAACDRPTQAYNFGWWDERVHHYLQRERSEKYFGLGERAGDMDRAGERYRLTNIDAMGYSARSSDPLYKHIPFYITYNPQAHLSFGLFYDTLSDCVFDFGKEIDNYHGPYRSFVADHGDLDCYFIAGPRVDQVVRRFTWLTGRPAFLPRWGLGCSGSSMAYTEAPDAQARMTGFIERCAEHDILCDSFHLSSGYTSTNGERYVFMWNRSKFPNPPALARSYLAKGVRLCANVKPCLLRNHPLFAEAAQLGLLIAGANGEPSYVQFWDEIGAYLDFTNPKTIAWWKAKVKETLLDYGIEATWNDNNEFEIWSSEALAHGFGEPYPARERKPLQSLLMVRASRDAQKEHAPGKRPFLVTRSGGAGMHRYAQTWSGDNFTSWETLRYNLKMGLGLALSGVSNSGHDIGGFAGPSPDPELFVRWVQASVLLPRFCIHSWHGDGKINAPWMHSQTAPAVCELIKLRYRLIPYLYDLLWRYHRDYEPMIRPTFLDFPDDPRCWLENHDMMVGGVLLAAPVVEPGQTHREVYLPSGTQWFDFWTGEVFEGGRIVTRGAPWSQPILFARERCAIPINAAAQSFTARADRRNFMIFPPIGSGTFIAESFEDDGESEAYRSGGYGGWRIKVEADTKSVVVAVQRYGAFTGLDADVPLIFPASETRSVSISRS
jgi:alpha-glucosidase